MTDASDDETLRVRRRSPADSPRTAADDTMGAATVPTVPEAEGTRRRSTYVPDGSGEDSPPEGSTIIARRTLSRSSSDQPSPSPEIPPPGAPADPSPLTRAASVPHPDSRYAPRDAAPVSAVRAPRAGHAPQAPLDGDAALSAQRRSARRTALIVVGAASALALLAASALAAVALLA